MFPFTKSNSKSPPSDSRSPSPAAKSSTPLSQAISQGTTNATTAVQKTVPALAHTIDSILDTPPAAPKPVVRPPAKLRPSWIGPARPDRPRTPGVEAMKQCVNVEYSSPGLQSPVYVFTSLSEPQWEAVEMQQEKTADGSIKFTKAFDVEEGDYQYKFRLGPGDWWVFDERKPTVDDGFGNKNNLLVVKPEPFKMQPPGTDHTKEDRVESKHATPVAASAISLPQYKEHTPAVAPPVHHEAPPPAPLMKHETFAVPLGSQSEQTPDLESKNPLSSYTSTYADSEDDLGRASDEEADLIHTSPLLRHETLRPSSAEHEHAPLFRHESIPVRNDLGSVAKPTAAKPTAASHVASIPHIPQEADPHDPSLEKFPTDHAGILETIHRTSTSLPADETSDHSLSSPLSQALTNSSASTRSLPSVDEEAEEELERIREVEEEEYEREEEDGEEMDPLREGDAPITPPMTDEEPEDDDFEPKRTFSDFIAKERLISELAEEPKNLVNRLTDLVGGEGVALAIAVGLLVVAAGLAAMHL
ncbi:uncharacterized protein LTR77_001916 [Saxophila tyrrhenica]|uniref:AMP-activated protein kinase glycogen-binding domain-containing protein n=1 Tax=Saxophila tyrrhenica TaxID=1690608 RepID=A0AAV9PP77_9PEZI|nr:hypothetical protein LTR77_001916 [Saxophila tyrrhenica]